MFDGPAAFGAREIVSSRKALAAHHIEPIPLQSKEHLGILNGTAFSASVAALALNDATHLALLAQVCTAMGTEALVGSRGPHDPFIHAIARPHPGQVRAFCKNMLVDTLTLSLNRLKWLAISGISWKAASWRRPMRRKLLSKTTREHFDKIAILCGLHPNFLDRK